MSCAGIRCCGISNGSTAAAGVAAFRALDWKVLKSPLTPAVPALTLLRSPGKRRNLAQLQRQTQRPPTRSTLRTRTPGPGDNHDFACIPLDIGRGEVDQEGRSARGLRQSPRDIHPLCEQGFDVATAGAGNRSEPQTACRSISGGIVAANEIVMGILPRQPDACGAKGETHSLGPGSFEIRTIS